MTAPAAAEPAPPVVDPLVGRVVADRYRIVGLIGRGGMGVVYLVEHVHIGKRVAMKLLHGGLTRRKEVVRRFQREAEVVSRLDHPNIVQVFDFGHSQGLAYLVMEFLEGRDFGKLIDEERPLSFQRVARICSQIASGVAHAHEHGVVHRDLKPENVMVRQRRDVPDQVKVLDFGLAKLRDESAIGTLTRAGTLMGTPYYMAPEYIQGEGATVQTDVYALGAIMYRALTGTPPFQADSSMAILTKHLTEAVVPPSARSGRGDLPPEADAIVLRAMAKDPRHRYARMEDLRRDLLTYLKNHGEVDPTLSSYGHSLELGPADAAATRVEIPLATKDDVDRYERRLRWRFRLTVLAGVLALAGAVGALWTLRDRLVPEAPRDRETEPNDEPATADALEEDVALRAFLGKRQSRSESDADVFLIENPGGQRRTVALEVSGLPNADLVFELALAGRAMPVLVSDSTGVAGAEAVPNFPLSGARYYLRVREKVEPGAYPTENVSDTYTVRWREVTPGPDDEREVNDRVGTADLLNPGATRRAFVGWDGDVDVFCAAGDADGRVRARLLEVPESLDLSLRVLDDGGLVEARVDEGGLGEPEVSPWVGPVRAEETCFEVVVTPGLGGGARADARRPYVLTLEREGEGRGDR